MNSSRGRVYTLQPDRERFGVYADQVAYMDEQVARLLDLVADLPAEVAAPEALGMLRRVRGWQENDIKAARAFVHIDRLVDRGGARRAPDDRPVDNPKYRDLSNKRRDVRDRLEKLNHPPPASKHDEAVWNGELLVG